MGCKTVIRFPRSAFLAILAFASLAAPCAAQSSSDESFFSRFNPFSGKSDSSAPASLDPKEPRVVDCPDIRVPSGESALRVGGEGSATVRHQFSVGQVARECGVAGKELTIKVGVKGRVVLGPAGSSGSYSAPLSISVRQQQGDKILASKTFTVGATIAPGTSGADFSVVTEPFAVPFTTEHAADDYEVVVGFGKGAKASPVEKRKRRQSKASGAGAQD
jgi:hypothetical protein